jgi:hypothetical protein
MHPRFNLPTRHLFSDTADTTFHIHLATCNRSGCESVPYCKMFPDIQTPAYMHADNHGFGTNSAIPV